MSFKDIFGHLMKRTRDDSQSERTEDDQDATEKKNKSMVISLDLSDADTPLRSVQKPQPQQRKGVQQRPVLVLRPQKWEVESEDLHVERVRVNLLNQSSLDLGLACTGFGMASSWYFLQRARRASNERYRIETDTKDIPEIVEMARDIYVTRDPTQSKFIDAMEELSTKTLKTLVGESWMREYRHSPIATLPLTMIILPVTYRIARTRFYMVDIGSDRLTFYTQDNIDNPILSQTKIQQRVREFLLKLIATEDKTILERTTPRTPRTSSSSSSSSSAATKVEAIRNRLKPYVELVDDLYNHQRSHLNAVRAGGDLHALEKALAFFTGENRDNLRNFYYIPLLDALGNIEAPPPDDLKKNETPDNDPALARSSLAVMAQELLDYGGTITTYIEIRGEPPSQPFEANRRRSLKTMPSIIEVAAQVLYSPYMINPETGVAYPFSILVSTSDSTTMSIFKDGYADSKWLLFDSHGSAGDDNYVAVRLFSTIESLGQYPALRYSYHSYEVYLRKDDRDAVMRNFSDQYRDTFGDLEPFQPLDLTYV